jgi:membrane fusion protein, multidrug efflux system
MQQRKWVMGGLALAVAVAVIATVLVRRGEASGPEKKADVPLAFSAAEVVRPQSLVLADSIDFSGPLVAPDTAVVRAKASGTLVQLLVKEGSRVKAGQRLGQIDLSDLAARLNERQATAEAVRTQMTQAERTHQNNQRLADQQFISPSALDASRAALDNAKAQYAATRAQVETARLAVRDAALVAPISGIVAKRFAVPGEKVSAEQQLLTIVDLSTLEMAGSVGTHEVPQLSVGMSVKVKVEGVAEPLTGQLTRIAPVADAGTRSIGVAVALRNPQERLRAGQYATAQVSLPAGEPRLTLPLAALGSASGQQFVWTVEVGKLVRRTVTTGRQDKVRGLVQVLEGLKPDAAVLAMRFENLREGAPATLSAATQSASAAASASAPRAL